MRKLSECLPKDPPKIVAPKACIYFPRSLWLFSRRVKQEPKKVSAPRRALEWGIQEEVCCDWQNAFKKRVFNKKPTLNYRQYNAQLMQTQIRQLITVI